MLIDYYISCRENLLQLLANGLIVLYIFLLDPTEAFYQRRTPWLTTMDL